MSPNVANSRQVAPQPQTATHVLDVLRPPTSDAAENLRRPTLPRTKPEGAVLILLVVGFVFSLLAALLAWKLAAWVTGPNVSDLGVPVHANATLAIASGLMAHICLAIAGLLALTRLGHAPTPTVWVYGISVTLASIGLLAFLVIEYG